MKRFQIAAIILVAFTGCASTARDDRRAVDILITGGDIVTMAGEPIENGAVAISGDTIVGVGNTSEMENRFTARRRISANGMAVMPGLVNAHTHAPMVLFRGIADDRQLMDWLQNFIFPAEKHNVDREFVKWGTRLAAAEMIRSGTTTFADMYYFEADIASETRAAGLRAVLGETMIDFPAPDNKTWSEAVAYVHQFVEAFRDDPLITPALAPHAPYTVSREHLEEVRRLATELRVPILIHIAETENEIEQVTKSTGRRPVEYLETLGFLGDDVVAAHAIWLDDGEIDTLVRRAVGVAHCPESNMMLASGIARVVDLLKRGAEVGLGTDGPAGSNNNLDMIEEMATAARLQKVNRKDPSALSARDVLRLATIGGAKVLGLDSRIGTIEEGKKADLIIIDLRSERTQPRYSVESAIVYSASSRDVVTTMVNGKLLMHDRKLLTLDLPAILAAAERYRDKITASLEPEN